MKTFKEIQEDIEIDKALDDLVEFRLISKATKKKIGRRFAKLAKTGAFKLKVQRAKRKIASAAKQKVKAFKMAKQKVINKYYPNYKEMGLAQRVKIDQLIQTKYSGMINKLTMKLAKVVKKKEIEKVKKARQAKQDA